MLPDFIFVNRQDAGQQLASAVAVQIAQLHQEAPPRTIVYALPRGGLPVAVPIARTLGCPLDVVVAKKIAKPSNPELAIGAVTACGQVIWSTELVIDEPSLQEILRRQAQEKAISQLGQLAPNRPAVSLDTGELLNNSPLPKQDLSPTGAIALLVDDGIATGMTMAVAVKALRQQNPAQIWICTPVAPQSLLAELHSWGDRAIILATPEKFGSVSRFYASFQQVQISEALACLEQQLDWL
ncbi:MAG: phosphoribosyltransferase [Hormoscilla sp.]